MAECLTKRSDNGRGHTECDDHSEYDQMPCILHTVQEIPVSSLSVWKGKGKERVEPLSKDTLK